MQSGGIVSDRAVHANNRGLLSRKPLKMSRPLGFAIGVLAAAAFCFWANVNLFTLVLLAILIAHIVYQLRTGELLTRTWNVETTRDENPTQFWVVISIETGVISWFLVLFVLEAIRKLK
jgi:hypothetical protein